jgi:elongation factor Tu
MSIEDVLSTEGRGTVATGRLERNRVKTGDEVAILGLTRTAKRAVVTSVERFKPVG